MSNNFTRRNFFKLASLGAVSYLGYNFNKILTNQKISGDLIGANYKAGHLLRTGISTIPQNAIEIETVIIGGGISGLSAAWWLKKNNYNQFLLLELDSDVGGNSRYGENSISKYPWGAHYLPIPNPESTLVKNFLEEINVITKYDNGIPEYQEEFLVRSPEERLLYNGKWNDGLVPNYGLSQADHEIFNSFFDFIKDLKNKKGNDGKKIFSIPLELSSRDEEYLKLDKISMFEFVSNQKWQSKNLIWYLDYCYRDDFGRDSKSISAWAGLHYFCSRNGIATNAKAGDNLTWPEGNGFLVRQLQFISQSEILKNSLVYKITIHNEKLFYVDVFNINTNETKRYITNNIIYSAPRFTIKKVLPDYQDPIDITYQPWVNANISLRELPYDIYNTICWDNVSYYSDTLGYVNSRHQDLTIGINDTVLTMYHPIKNIDATDARIKLFATHVETWKQFFLDEITKMNPELKPYIKKIDIWFWGHGMVSPEVNYIWNHRLKMPHSFKGIQFAHSDMSGISIFEEAQYQGVMAAKEILKKIR